MTKDKLIPDEFAGHGGSYLVSKDGKKTLVERTAQTETKPAPAAVSVQDKPARDTKN